MSEPDPMEAAFSAALGARYRTISDREDMDLDAHAAWVGEWFAQVRADERERIAQAIKEMPAAIHDGDRSLIYVDEILTWIARGADR